MNRRVRINVRGRVQGVGFRYATAARAQHLGIAGWVRNRGDGSVEIVADGKVESVNDFVAWCSQGPRGARVSDIAVLDEPTQESHTAFTVRY